MRIEPGIVVGVLCAVIVWLFLRWRSPRPEFPPLQTSPKDPLMVDALAKAKASVGRFLELARAPQRHALVKLYFVSNSNEVEHLWAEVIEIVGESELRVRLVTPPVSHSGHLERLYQCSTEDIEDWQIRDGQGKIHGGFSQRAMFAIARRDGVKLPKKLLRHEAEYADA